MTLRVPAGFAAGVARLIGWARHGRRRRLAAHRREPGLPATRPSQSPYVVAPPRLRRLRGWSVHNRVSNRVIAAGMSQGQAETLCLVLDFVCHWAHSGSDAVQRRHDD